MDQGKILNYYNDSKGKLRTSITNSIFAKIKYQKNKTVFLVCRENQINGNNYRQREKSQKWIELSKTLNFDLVTK